MSLSKRIKNAYNAFMNNKDPTWEPYGGTSYRPDRVRSSHYGDERTIINAIINRIAVDIAQTTIQHVVADEDGYYKETKDSTLNQCLTVSANLDQTGFAFKQDAVQALLNDGYIAIVPIHTNKRLDESDSYEIYSIRVGKIVAWFPDKVRVEVYNEEKGTKEELNFSKQIAVIVENPFFAVMNEDNSVVKRYIRKLTLLDSIDEQTSSGKLDLIIQLPYPVKTESRRAQADRRRQDIVDQLTNNAYGIAYTDASEKITQLNRPVENNLMSQIEYLTNLIFSQLGITQSILDGTADEQTLVNYNTRTLAPILTAITDEMTRKFLSPTARSQGQKIMFFRDPFNMVPVGKIAEMSDSLTRNEIMSSNEVRQRIGMKPSSDPRADELLNKNLNHEGEDTEEIERMEENQNGDE